MAVAVEKEFERAELLSKSDDSPAKEVKTTQRTRSRAKSGAKNDRKNDKKNDTVVRTFGTAEKACAEKYVEAFKAHLLEGKPKPVKETIVATYVKSHPQFSVGTILQSLSQHTKKWKPGCYDYPEVPAKKRQRKRQR